MQMKEHANGTPAGVKPIEWRLMTNRGATSVAEVIALIDWYRARWELEMRSICSTTTGPFE